jgi:hypothetical protein
MLELGDWCLCLPPGASDGATPSGLCPAAQSRFDSTLMPTKTASPSTGSFTLPGEAGYEDLTLRLARTWGADTIRDSDGTQLSDQIVESGYNIYSTLCLVRADNAWARANPTKLQQTWLMSFPVMADGNTVRVDLLTGYFREQFRVNADDAPHGWWQVFDRTAGVELPTTQWDFDAASGTVTIRATTAWHSYTVNFFAYRIWEEISMYNHVTNNWGDREHLMPIDPIHPEAREQMLAYLDRWIAAHPHTKVVRFTSMFYNFFWPWGDEPKRRFVINDWGSYEFSVSPAALLAFEKAKGYRPKSEDFVNAGLYCTSHAVPSKVYRDWIDFMVGFVTDFSRICVERVHAAGKQAYVFYNDHWIGLEPTDPRFVNIGFDGVIDGIFSGFEARKVAATPGVSVRELRLHPYFFPTGVNGAPSCARRSTASASVATCTSLRTIRSSSATSSASRPSSVSSRNSTSMTVPTSHGSRSPSFPPGVTFVRGPAADTSTTAILTTKSWSPSPACPWKWCSSASRTSSATAFPPTSTSSSTPVGATMPGVAAVIGPIRGSWRN